MKEIERMHLRLRCNETAALRHTAEAEREKLLELVAQKEAEIAKFDAAIAELQARIASE